MTMQDRLKFRFWRFNNVEKKWKQEIFVDLMSIDGSGLPFDNTEGGAYTEYDTEYITEQCTGLKDKNGKLIYEGDIVKETSFDEDSALGREFEEISVICFGGGEYPCSFTMKSERFYRGFALLNYGINRLELEIIGNIHENADLLENKDE